MAEVSFQYFSDLHLEMRPDGNLPIIEAVAPYLIIAGDIGNPMSPIYREFLESLTSQFTKIFVIAGNHEYYNDSKPVFEEGYPSLLSSTVSWMSVVDRKIREICKSLPNVIFLQNETYVIPETHIVVYGTTLWSRIDYNRRFEVKFGVADYHLIPHFTTEKSTQLFEENLETLTQEVTRLSELPEKWQIIVVSHHLPTTQLIHSKYRYGQVNSAFVTEVDISHHDSIVAWVCGHTHVPMEVGKFHINPIGYPHENLRIDYSKKLTLIEGNRQLVGINHKN